MTEVKNLNGTTKNTPKEHASWKAWWEAKQGRKFSYCSVSGCIKSAEVGAHVKKAHGSNKWYIVPLCIGCNNKPSSEQFEVSNTSLEAV
ncbi:MAG: hypothetical protein FWE19_08870 [Oscillospiraceae bacterium]|nr:hypothetical protein [Oscillospiraceae bacterium]